ncbi:MAG: replicative DNA helicase, partial [Spiribacter salinus]
QSARTGRMTDQDWQKLARAAGKLSEAQVFIDDTPGLSVLELRAKARRLKAEHDIGLLVVDYLQLMHAPTNSRSGNREQEIAQISRSLKSLAKELDIPVIALSQLSRAVENRGGDKRPQLSDLRESGSIEQDADGLAEIIIGKQRNGPIGTVSLAFVDQYARFENLTQHYGEEVPGSGDGYGDADDYGAGPAPLPSTDAPF